MEPALTLVNVSLDLQITICMFLHPSDILALRKTCKALELASRQRIVWVTALHRVCLDNYLFLPSFPIIDMSDLELERAAMRPRRWLELCGALQKGDLTSTEMIHTRTTRLIEDPDKSEYLMVPGGRYLVTAGNGISVWDLGYVSTVDCKLIASVGQGTHYQSLKVQATPDGKGLVILLSDNSFGYNVHLSSRFTVFEIYPQNEIPLITQTARFTDSKEYPTHLLPNILICEGTHASGMIFKVVDYRTNYSTRFIANVTSKDNDPETFATKTAIIVCCKKGILIWPIPPLSPQSSDIPDDDDPIPALIKIPFPDCIARHARENLLEWKTLSPWYFGFGGETIYFDMIYHEMEKIQRLKLVIKPDLSDTSLHVIHIPEFIPDELAEAIDAIRHSEGYKICEDALVYFWNNHRTWVGYTGLTSPPFTKFLTRWDGQVKTLCPTSGRFVCRVGEGKKKKSWKTFVVDLF